MKALSADLSSLEDELNSMKPPARDVKTVRNQQDDLSKFIKKVKKKKNVKNKNKIHIQHSTLNYWSWPILWLLVPSSSPLCAYSSWMLAITMAILILSVAIRKSSTDDLLNHSLNFASQDILLLSGPLLLLIFPCITCP